MKTKFCKKCMWSAYNYCMETCYSFADFVCVLLAWVAEFSEFGTLDDVQEDFDELTTRISTVLFHS